MEMVVNADIYIDLGDVEAELRDEYGDEYEPNMLMPMAAARARETIEMLVGNDGIVGADPLSEAPA